MAKRVSASGAWLFQRDGALQRARRLAQLFLRAAREEVRADGVGCEEQVHGSCGHAHVRLERLAQVGESFEAAAHLYQNASLERVEARRLGLDPACSHQFAKCIVELRAVLPRGEHAGDGGVAELRRSEVLDPVEQTEGAVFRGGPCDRHPVRSAELADRPAALHDEVGEGSSERVGRSLHTDERECGLGAILVLPGADARADRVFLELGLLPEREQRFDARYRGGQLLGVEERRPALGALVVRRCHFGNRKARRASPRQRPDAAAGRTRAGRQPASTRGSSASSSPGTIRRVGHRGIGRSSPACHPGNPHLLWSLHGSGAGGRW